MTLRKATFSELPVIWEILQQAIEQRRQDGSEQWQNGYPNEETIHNDIKNENAYVLIDENVVIAYVAILSVEPAYNNIKGKWLTSDDYMVLHRVATSSIMKRKGVATHLFRMIENLCIKQKVYSIKVDTNFDNAPMLRILDKLSYIYCGDVFVDGAPRRAYEKVILGS